MLDFSNAPIGFILAATTLVFLVTPGVGVFYVGLFPCILFLLVWASLVVCAPFPQAPMHAPFLQEIRPGVAPTWTWGYHDWLHRLSRGTFEYDIESYGKPDREGSIDLEGGDGFIQRSGMMRLAGYIGIATSKFVLGTLNLIPGVSLKIEEEGSWVDLEMGDDGAGTSVKYADNGFSDVSRALLPTIMEEWKMQSFVDEKELVNAIDSQSLPLWDFTTSSVSSIPTSYPPSSVWDGRTDAGHLRRRSH
jgi:hypothetical protein